MGNNVTFHLEEATGSYFHSEHTRKVHLLFLQHFSVNVKNVTRRNGDIG